MKLQTFSKHLFIQVLLFGTLGVIYAAWNDTVNTGDGLTAAKWNELVAQVENAAPSGAVMAFNLGACPTGWSAIAAANGRMIVGVGTLGSDTYSLSDTGGSATHTLTEAELPSHTHSFHGEVGPGTTTTPGNNMLANGNQYAPLNIANPEPAMADEAIGNTGSGQAHENRPPYLAFLYCEKD